MKYINSNSSAEALHIKRCPKNRIDAYNKLLFLQERAEHYKCFVKDFVIGAKPSKRQIRLRKMYWAFRRMNG